MKIEVGQVWFLRGDHIMVSSVISAKEVFIGKAVKRGSSYAIVGSPTMIDCDELRTGRLVFDTEAA